MKAKQEVSLVFCLVMRFNKPSGLGHVIDAPKGGGAAGLQPPPPKRNNNNNKKRFYRREDIRVLYDICFSQNQPLKLAGD
jgi:hypothetical protein